MQTILIIIKRNTKPYHPSICICLRPEVLTYCSKYFCSFVLYLDNPLKQMILFLQRKRFRPPLDTYFTIFCRCQGIIFASCLHTYIHKVHLSEYLFQRWFWITYSFIRHTIYCVPEPVFMLIEQYIKYGNFIRT